MEAILIHFKKDEQDNTVHIDGKPQHQLTRVQLPIKFVFGSFNLPKQVSGYKINVDDIISIEEPITHERDRNNILWTVPHSVRNGRTNSQIMEEYGYHPAGYGQPTDEHNFGKYSTFKCWSNCD